MIPFLRPSWLSVFSRPAFHDPGILRDGDLELIPPSAQRLDAMMASVEHPMTHQDAPDLARLSRRQASDFLSACPGGRQKGGSASAGGSPAYHFWMLDHSRPDLPMAGAIGLRIGTGQDLVLYYGHVGYHVFPPHRGRHFAERAVRLLLPLAARHGLNPLWITCNPNNWGSLRTCDRLGAKLVETIPVPPGHPLYLAGEVAKCRFRLDHSRPC